MGSMTHDTGTHRAPHVGAGDHLAPVIADAGDDAWVVLVRSSLPLSLGSRFSFGGLDWEIVRDRDLVRGFVAWPVIRSLAVS